MKKFLLFAGLAFAGTIFAQSNLTLTDPNTGGPANYSYYFWVGATDPTVSLEFPVTNTSSGTIKSRIKKTIITTVSGQDVYFCYGTNCFTPTTFYSTPVNVAGGAQLPNGNGTYGLRTDFDANSVLGLSVVRYTLYDSLNHADSVNVTISYNVTATGIKNFTHAAVGNASPNPASSAVNFSYDLNDANSAAIKIYNSLGNLVKTVALTPGSKNAQVDVSSLSEGFYFYSILSDGKAVGTRRLVITR